VVAVGTVGNRKLFAGGAREKKNKKFFFRVQEGALPCLTWQGEGKKDDLKRK